MDATLIMDVLFNGNMSGWAAELQGRCGGQDVEAVGWYNVPSVTAIYMACHMNIMQT